MTGERTGQGLWQRELGATLTLAWPLILSNLTMSAINATDAWLMGRLGAQSLAASALGLNMAFVFSLICLGIIAASSPMMATALGRRVRSVAEVRRTFRQAVWLILTIIPPVWLLLWHAESLMIMLGQDPALAALGDKFLKGYLWSSLPFLLFNAMRNFISALERPQWVLAISLIGVTLNGLLGYGLIFGAFGLPELGIFGGGLASTIVWWLMVLMLVAVIFRDRQFRRYHIFARFWRPDWARYRDMWKLGLPIGLAMGFEGGVFSAAAYLQGLLGQASLAAHAIALQIAAVSFMVPWGISQASTVRVGLMLGRGDKKGIARAGWTGWSLGVGFMSMMAVVIFMFPRELFTLFLVDSPENAHVIALGTSFLLVAAIFQIVDGAQVVGAGILRGLHDTKIPMVFTFIGYWLIGIGIGAWLAFCGGWAGVGIWIGLAVGLAIVAVLMLARWMMRDRLGLTHAE